MNQKRAKTYKTYKSDSGTMWITTLKQAKNPLKAAKSQKNLKNSAPLGACPSGAPKRIKRTKKCIK
jgi:hypothetical protein